MNLPIYDKTLERFNNTDFPEEYTPVYLGHMNDECSLGRYAMAISHEHMPLSVSGFGVRPLIKKDFDFTSPTLNRQVPADMLLAYAFQLEYALKEPIAAYQLEFYFFDIWGNSTYQKQFMRLTDFTDPSFIIQKSLSFDYGDELLQHFLFQETDSLLSDFLPIQFHICFVHVSACRTTDGLIFKAPEDTISAALNFSIPRN